MNEMPLGNSFGRAYCRLAARSRKTPAALLYDKKREEVGGVELLIPLDNHMGLPYYEQIYSYIREEIKSGHLRASVRLPSTRLLAENLKVSRSTTQMAYEQLLSEGYIEAVPCKGYYVSRIEELVDTGQRKGEAVRKREGGRLLCPSFAETDRAGICGAEQNTAYRVDFSPRGVDMDRFPFPLWRKLTKNTVVEDNRELFAAGHPQGEPAFREAIREYLHSARGVRCRAEQIVVGAGSEYLLMLLSRILGAHRLIAMENPTYKQAYRVFQSLGYPVIPVRMDSSGLDVSLLDGSGADLVYVMPSHQYPTGTVMPVKRRQELLSWAYKKEGRYLIEDDYDSEFRYKGKPIPALQGMDGGERVIYSGTFSKSVAPAIRISYLVLPEPLLCIYRDCLSFFTSTVSRIDQSILYQFMTEGYYERHLNRMRAVYKAKHDTLLRALKPLEKQFLIGGENAGLHLLLTAKNGRTEEELLKSAKRAGVKVYGLSSYVIGEDKRGASSSTVILGFAVLDEEAIREGIRLLLGAWRPNTEEE